MQKPLAISIALCLSFAGCQLVQKSATWETVVNVRPGDSFHNADPSSDYAEKLHRVLLEQGVEHIVVTYQYHYYTHQYEEALATRTAVVYRDDVDGSYPWWLKDDRLDTPVWLPNGDLAQQLSFYCRRTAEVIEQKVYPAHGRGSKEVKEVVRTRTALAHPQPQKQQVAERPQPVTKIAQAKPAPVQPAKPVAATVHASATPSHHAAVTSIQRPPTAEIAKPKPANEPAPTTFSTTRANPFWAPPVSLAPVAQGHGSAPSNEHLEKLFRARNGTSYDRTSAMDRRKMEQIKHGLADNKTDDSLRGIDKGVDGLETRAF